MDYFLLSQIFLIGFLVNLVWEVNHSVLYKTCYELPYERTMKLLTIMSIKDGFWITLFYSISFLVFEATNPIVEYRELILFVVLALVFSFLDEKISVKKGRWSYTDQMPTVLGVGATPLFELALTGIITFFIVFYVF